MLRGLRIALEFIAGFIGLLSVLGLILIWRLDANPMQSTFLTPYIVSGIDRALPDTHTEIGHTLVRWDNVTHAVQLLADNLLVKDKDDIIIAEIPHLGVQLSVWGMLIGQFVPLELTADHPQIQLEHGVDGKLHFGGISTGGKNVAASGDPRESLKNALDQLGGGYFTRRVVIDEMILTLHDTVGKTIWAVHVPDINLKRTFEGLAGHIAVDLPQKDKTATIELRYTYNRFSAQHDLATHFQNITPSQLVGGHPEALGVAQASILDLPLTGNVGFTFDRNLDVAAGSVDIQGGPGQVIYPDFWDKPRDVKSIDVQGSYIKKTHHLDVIKGVVDFGGPKLNITASGDKAKNPKNDLDFTFFVTLTDWPADAFGELWPKPIITNARDWIAKNVSKGIFDRGDAQFKGSLAWNDLSNIDISSGEGTVSASHADVKYVDTMPPVQDVSAEGAFDLNQMSVKITGGGIGALRLQPFTLALTDFDKDLQYINIPLKVVGPIPEVMRLIDYPPLGYAKAVGLKPDDITGTASGEIDLQMPLLNELKMDAINVNAKATLTDLTSSKLVKGIAVSEGNLALVLSKDDFTLDGPLLINGISSHLEWQEYFKHADNRPERRGTIAGTIKDNQWKAIGFDTSNNIKGPTTYTIRIQQPNKSKTLIDADFDLSSAELKVVQLNWKKAAGSSAQIKLSSEITDGKDTVIKSFSLHGAQANVSGNARLTKEGAVRELILNPIAVGRTNASIYYSVENSVDGKVRLEAKGAALDLSGFAKENKTETPSKGDLRPREFHVALGKLYTSDTGFISGVEGYALRDRLGWSEINIHGMAGGTHQLDFELTPKNGGRALSISCDDFGEALNSMGFTDTVQGGDLKIAGGSSPDNPRAIEGTIKASSFTVTKMPAMLVLLNATSPFGFSGIVTNSVSFDRIRGKFLWQGDQIELKPVSVSGKSIGLNIEGRVDMQNNEAHLHGTLVPFSAINNVLGAIPIVGDILTGGNGGGVLAVSYRIDGPLNKPDVSVNPVSLLTPGFLRNLFFGGETDDTIKGSEEDKKAQADGPVDSAPSQTKR